MVANETKKQADQFVKVVKLVNCYEELPLDPPPPNGRYSLRNKNQKLFKYKKERECTIEIKTI